MAEKFRFAVDFYTDTKNASSLRKKPGKMEKYLVSRKPSIESVRPLPR